MKKWMSIILALLICLSLVACGTTAEEAINPQNTVEEEKNEETTRKEDSEAVEETLEAEEKNEGTEEDFETEDTEEIKEKAFSKKCSIEETILVDEKGITITATELSIGDREAELNLLLENETQDDLRFMSGTLGYSCNSINGYMVETGYVSTTVAAGKKARVKMEFDLDDLEVYGIREIAEIGVGFLVDKADGYEDVLETGPIFIQTSISDDYNYENESFSGLIKTEKTSREFDFFTDALLFNEEDFQVVSAALFHDKYDNQFFVMEVVNNSEQLVYARTRNIAIDNVEVCYSTWTVDAISPGKKALLSVKVSSLLDEPEYELLGLSDIHNISLTLNIEEEDKRTDITSGEITVQISEGENLTENIGAPVFEGAGITIYSLGLSPDKYSSSKDIHLFFLVVNNTGGEIRADIKDGSASIDGFVIKDLTFGSYISADKCGVLDIELQGSSLEDNGIKGIEDISNLEVTLDIEDERYAEIARPTIVLEF